MTKLLSIMKRRKPSAITMANGRGVWHRKLFMANAAVAGWPNGPQWQCEIICENISNATNI